MASEVGLAEVGLLGGFCEIKEGQHITIPSKGGDYAASISPPLLGPEPLHEGASGEFSDAAQLEEKGKFAANFASFLSLPSRPDQQQACLFLCPSVPIFTLSAKHGF